MAGSATMIGRMLPLDGISLGDLAKRSTQMDLKQVVGETPVLVFRPGPGDGPLLFVTPPDGEEIVEEGFLVETQPTARRRRDPTARGYASPSAVVVALSKSNRNAEVDDEIIRVGRARTNDIRLVSDQVSKVHGSFERVETVGTRTWHLVDQGSVNGTFINGLRLDLGTAYAIRPGDEVRFADVQAVFLDAEGLVSLCKELTGEAR